jgi:hypothetical protein
MLEEGGEHHNFNRVGCWDILTGGRAPLQHLMMQEKIALDKLTDLIFIGDRQLEQVWVRGSHGEGRGLR